MELKTAEINVLLFLAEKNIHFFQILETVFYWFKEINPPQAYNSNKALRLKRNLRFQYRKQNYISFFVWEGDMIVTFHNMPFNTAFFQNKKKHDYMFQNINIRLNKKKKTLQRRFLLLVRSRPPLFIAF
jgi:hypothetical protein